MNTFSGWEKAILHVDADAFFASVEEVLRPDLKGRPVIVGGAATGRGVVSSANYIARKSGVRSAMSMREAVRLCPGAVISTEGRKYYGRFSEKMFEVCRKYTPFVEVTSIDEGYLDITGTELMHGMSLREVAKKILVEINGALGISVSGGLAGNKTVAKIASGMNKPHALTTVMPGKEASFLAGLPIEKMPGIGPKTKLLLNNYNLKVLGDIAGMSMEEAYKMMGVHGVSLWKRTRGVDDRAVRTEGRDRKSISKERTFGRDHDDKDYLLKILKNLISQVLFSLRNKGMKAHTLNMKIRYEDFKTFTFSRALHGPVDSDFEIFPILKELFLEKIKSDKKVRLVGCGVSDLRSEYNKSIFSIEEKKKNDLVNLGDLLRKKYGMKTIDFGVE